jgi:CRP-like cAMP-binding protein
MKAAPNDNRLLALLPDRERRRLISECDVVELRFGAVLTRQDEPIRQVYFPTGGVVALQAQLDRRPGIDVGLVGGEGAVGMVVALGVRVAPVGAVVQGAGSALSISAAGFTRALVRSPPMSALIARYLYVFVTQLAAAVSCARFHLVEARLARWLLLTRDRMGADDFHLTHEFMAHVLGVRRVGVTHAAHVLRTQKLVSYSRGYIRILDVRGLQAAACSCYATNRELYARVMVSRGTSRGRDSQKQRH